MLQMNPTKTKTCVPETNANKQEDDKSNYHKKTEMEKCFRQLTIQGYYRILRKHQIAYYVDT